MLWHTDTGADKKREKRRKNALWLAITTLLVLLTFQPVHADAQTNTIYIQSAKTTLDTSNCGVRQENGTYNTSACGLFVGTKIHREQASTTAVVSLTASSTIYATFYAGMDGASWGTSLTNPIVRFSIQTCTFFAYLSTTTLTATTLATPHKFVNIPLYANTGNCTNPPANTPFLFDYGDGNWNGQMSSYTNGTEAHGRNYFILSTSPANDTSTRIDTIIPFDGALVASSTPFTLEAYGFVNVADIPVNENNYPLFGNEEGLSISWTIAGIANSCISAICALESTPTFVYREPLIVVTAVSQSFNAATTSNAITQVGIYNMSTKLERPTTIFGFSSFFGLFGFGYDTLASVDSVFTVGTTTSLGTSLLAIRDATETEFTSTTTEAVLNSCLPLPPFFSINDCIEYLFVPQTRPAYQSTFDRIATKAPFGYWTEISNTLSTATTSTSTPLALSYAIFGISAIEALMSPLRVGLSIILWLATFLWIFHRIRRFDFHA